MRALRLRIDWLATAMVVGIVSATAVPQDPPKPQRLTNANVQSDVFDNEIDVLLRKWHASTSNIKLLYTEFNRTVTDKAFGAKQVNGGSARFSHPNRARMDIREDDGKHGRETFLLTEWKNPHGKSALQFFHYRMDDKQLRIIEFEDADLSKRDPQEEGPLRLLFGINPETAHQRYKFDILDRTPTETSIRIEPKHENERQEYLHAVVALHNKTFMPSRLTIQESQQNVAVYEFLNIRTNLTEEMVMKETDFHPRKVDEKAWRVTREKKSLRPATPGPVKTARRPNAGDPGR